MFLSTIFTIINDLILNVLFLPFIVSAVVNNLPIERLLFICGIMIVVRIVIEMFNSWKNSIYIPKSDSEIEYGFQSLLFDKMEKIDLIKYDDPEFYNNSIWIANDVNKRSVEVLNTFFNWSGDILMVGSILAIIINFEPILLICTVIPSVLSLTFKKKINKIAYKLEQSNILHNRKMDYVNKLFTSVSAAKEFRLYSNITNPLIKLYNQSVHNKNELINKYSKKIAILLSSLSIGTFFFSHVIAMIYLAYRTIVVQSIDAGIVITLTNSIWQISARINSLLGIVNRMQKHSMYVNNFKRFLAIESNIKENKEGKLATLRPNSIRLEHISYKYPNNTAYVLKDINMEIKRGEKIAIVGCNGAGKSTLIKLIMRLYIPLEGRVYLDDEPAQVYNLRSFRDRFGVIFQDFKLYTTSVLENVILNNSSHCDSEKELVDQALINSGLYKKIYNEKNNLQTSVNRDFDENGLILSGGEAQKLAIARVFAKDCGVVIMDEPSAALDPFSEYEIHNNMLQVSKDKTVILISHRLSTTKNADRIYYIDDGQIAEVGSHEELMKEDGLYAKMFKIQSEKYTLNSRLECEESGKISSVIP